MGYVWFLKLALKCIDHLAWPLLALGYPLCASVQAIETDSYKETRDLISYWILVSLIYLFEYAFLTLLEWFQFWPYIKLTIIFWLIIPDFGRASYVYNNLICAYISMKPQAVMSKLKNCRKLFVKKEDFLLQADIFMEENGAKALQKLIASKNTTHNSDAEAKNAIRAADKNEMQQNTTHNSDAQAANAIRATDEKEMQQTNGKRLQTEHKDIKDLEVIEKKVIPAGKQDIPVMPNVAPSQNASSVTVETKGMTGKATAGRELPQSSIHKEVQKQWTCAVCQLTTTCEKNLNTHMLGNKHRAKWKALKAKFQPVPQKLKNDKSKEELKQQNIINQHANSHAQTSREPDKGMLNDAVQQRTIKGPENKSRSRQKGVHAPANKTHQLNAKTKNGESKGQEDKSTSRQKGVHAPANKTHQLNAKTKNGGSKVNNGLKGKVVIDHKVQELQKNLSKPVGMGHSKLRCEVCNVTCTRERDMASHLNGRKHLANVQI